MTPRSPRDRYDRTPYPSCRIAAMPAAGPSASTREGESPARNLDQRRDFLNGDHGERKAERGLQGERGAHRVRRRELGDYSAELGRVGDDENPQMSTTG